MDTLKKEKNERGKTEREGERERDTGWTYDNHKHTLILQIKICVHMRASPRCGLYHTAHTACDKADLKWTNQTNPKEYCNFIKCIAIN